MATAATEIVEFSPSSLQRQDEDATRWVEAGLEGCSDVGLGGLEEGVPAALGLSPKRVFKVSLRDVWLQSI